MHFLRNITTVSGLSKVCPNYTFQEENNCVTNRTPCVDNDDCMVTHAVKLKFCTLLGHITEEFLSIFSHN